MSGKIDTDDLIMFAALGIGGFLLYLLFTNSASAQSGAPSGTSGAAAPLLPRINPTAPASSIQMPLNADMGGSDFGVSNGDWDS